MNEKIDPDVVTKFEHETWNRCADEYLDTFAGLTRETIPLLLEAAQIRNGSKTLDIGSGPGHVAETITQAGAVVTGVDFSGQMVEVAKRHYPHIAFQEANAEQLPFEAGTFDAVVSNFVVHHLARPEIVFGEVCRVLKPGGRFAFTVFESPEAQSSIGAFFAAVEAHHDLGELPHGPLFGMTDQSVYKKMLSAGGLHNCHLETPEIIWKSETLEPILGGFWKWGNMAALPDDTQKKIETATRANMAKHRQGDHYEFPHTALMGIAEKP